MVSGFISISGQIDYKMWSKWFSFFFSGGISPHSTNSSFFSAPDVHLDK